MNNAGMSVAKQMVSSSVGNMKAAVSSSMRTNPKSSDKLGNLQLSTVAQADSL